MGIVLPFTLCVIGCRFMFCVFVTVLICVKCLTVYSSKQYPFCHTHITVKMERKFIIQSLSNCICCSSPIRPFLTSIAPITFLLFFCTRSLNIRYSLSLPCALNISACVFHASFCFVFHVSYVIVKHFFPKKVGLSIVSHSRFEIYSCVYFFMFSSALKHIAFYVLYLRYRTIC